MSRPDHHHLSSCEHGVDAGAYLLHALTDEEHHDFQQHLDGCAECRREVVRLQAVVDTLPIAAPQLMPPPELKDRIMRVVDAEAELLRAAGPEADRVTAAPESTRRRRGWRSGLFLRPAVAGGLATVLIAVGVGGGLLVSGGGPDTPTTRTLQAQVSAKDASATLAVQGERAALQVVNLPSAPSGKIYQVWIKHRGSSVPQPTHTLFNVRKTDGSAIVPIEEPVATGDQVLVTDEPDGGSPVPTGRQIISATSTA